ncbi:MAG: hypothetical protein AABY22_03850 [Nanoarchaeota archaeon]
MKSHNPFKLWGSYVGAILPQIIVYISFFGVGIRFPGSKYLYKALSYLYNPIVNVAEFFYSISGSKIFAYLILSIIGFFIGWTIHLIIRDLWERFKK